MDDLEEDCPLCGGIGEIQAVTNRDPSGHDTVGCPVCIEWDLKELLAKAETDNTALRRENDELRVALHDAIVRPSGVVPQSAQPFYRTPEAIRAEARRPVYGTRRDQKERAYIESAAARTLAETGR